MLGKEAEKIAGTLIHAVWSLGKWALTLAVFAALAGGVYLYAQLDSKIRASVEQLLAEHYSEFDVRVRSAQLIEGRGIEVRGISIAHADAQPGRPALLQIDEIMVQCSPTLAQLVQKKLDVQNVFVRHPRLHATCDTSGTWDVSRLLPLPKFGGGRPRILVEGGTLELVDLNRPTAASTKLRDLKLSIQRQPADDGAPSLLAITGGMRSDYVQQVSLDGFFEPDSGAWQFRGGLEGIELCPELLASLPQQAAARLHSLEHVRAQGTLQFEASFDPVRAAELLFAVDGEFTRGRVDDPRLPMPLTEMVASVHCTNELIEARLTALGGPTRVRLSAKQFGYEANSEKSISLHAENVQLDPHMAGRLPETLQQQWKKYLPAGEVNLALQLHFDGQRWESDVVTQCVDVSFTYHKFPYRLYRTTGQLVYRHDRLRFDLTSHGGERPIRIQGEVRSPGPQATGWVEIRGNQLTVDQPLVSALPAKGRRVFDSLNPSGTFDFQWRSWRDDPRQRRLHSRLNLAIRNATIKYDRFPYPLTGVRGTIEMLDGHWKFRNLEGTNDTGLVTCSGSMVPAPNGSELVLIFTGAEIPLEGELRDALPEHTRRLWADLKPRGAIDLTGEVRYRSADRKFSLGLRIEPVGETASIEPTPFPYRLENVRGKIYYRDGKIEVENLRAAHGQTSLAARAVCQARRDGSWYLHLDKLTVDRLAVDRDLILALPAGLRRIVTKLDPQGPVNLRGSLALAGNTNTAGPPRSQWDLTFNMHQGQLNCGVELKNICGEVRLVGDFDGLRLRSAGELSLDSLTYQVMQLTDIRGPLWIDNQRVLLGAWAGKEQGKKQPRSITAKLYGGSVVGDGWVHLVEVPRFALDATLADARLQRFARESLPGHQKLKGNVHMRLSLQGTARGTHSLAGSGNVRLSRGELYELPVILPLLKVLRIRAPDTTAFTRSDMDFRIEGEHIYFDRLNLLGDAVSLYGKGEMSLDREVQMTFHSVVGRNDLPVPLLRNIVGEASEQIMQIHVRGTVNNPSITTQPLPALNQALQQIGADLQPKR